MSKHNLTAHWLYSSLGNYLNKVSGVQGKSENLWPTLVHHLVCNIWFSVCRRKNPLTQNMSTSCFQVHNVLIVVVCGLWGKIIQYNYGPCNSVYENNVDMYLQKTEMCETIQSTAQLLSGLYCRFMFSQQIQFACAPFYLKNALPVCKNTDLAAWVSVHTWSDMLHNPQTQKKQTQIP